MSTIVAHIEARNKAKIKVTETKIDKPSRRSNFTFVTHPEKDELILFGGEFHNGKNVSIIIYLLVGISTLNYILFGIIVDV